LQRIANATTTPSDFGVAISAVLRPAQIVNYRSMGTTPLRLGVSLAVGAVAAPWPDPGGGAAVGAGAARTPTALVLRAD
jgi:hypothetical protein